jgi:hypothetical protein
MQALAWLRRNPDLAALAVIAAMAALISMARGMAMPEFRRMEPVIVDMKPRVMTIDGRSREALREAREELRRRREEIRRLAHEFRDEVRSLLRCEPRITRI